MARTTQTRPMVKPILATQIRGLPTIQRQTVRCSGSALTSARYYSASLSREQKSLQRTQGDRLAVLKKVAVLLDPPDLCFLGTNCSVGHPRTLRLDASCRQFDHVS